MTEQTGNAQALIELIAKKLVDDPDQVFVDQFEEDGETVLELEVAESDMGKIIGRHGRTVRALRNLLGAVGMKSNKRYALEILE